MPRYQLSLVAEKLPRGFFRRPNPYAKVYVSGGPREGEIIGQTEVIQDAQSADWVNTFFIETDPSIFLPLKVSIYDDRNDTLLTEQVFEATEVNSNPGHVQENKASNGARIVASVEDSLRGNAIGSCTLQLRGLDIKNIEPGLFGLGRSDPFFEIARKNADHSAGVVGWNTIFRSVYIVNHLNPLWPEFTLSLEILCFGDTRWPLKVTVFDYQSNGKHRAIGSFETNLETMEKQISIRGNADREIAFGLYEDNEKMQRKNVGLICVLKANIQLEDL